MTLAVTVEQLNELLQKDSLIRGFGFQIYGLEKGSCTLHIPYQSEFERPGGTIFGPLYMAAADAAFWFAITTHIGLERMAVTSELNTAFLSAASKEDVRCQATILKMGSRRIYGTAQCSTVDGRLLTHHTLTYMESTPRA